MFPQHNVQWMPAGGSDNVAGILFKHSIMFELVLWFNQRIKSSVS